MVNNPANFQRPTMSTFTQVILYTDTDGFAKFREETIPLNEGNPQSMLSEVFASGGYQLRTSPVGFRSQFHCSGHTQWCFILQGQMEIGVHGSSRVFGPGPFAQAWLHSDAPDADLS